MPDYFVSGFVKPGAMPRRRNVGVKMVDSKSLARQQLIPVLCVGSF